MSRTRIIDWCDSSNIASPMTSLTDIWYPRVRKRSDLSTRSGVLRRPPRAGSSPISFKSSVTAACIAFFLSAIVVHPVPRGLVEPDAESESLGDMGSEFAPHNLGDVFRRGEEVAEPGDVEVQVLVIELGDHVLLGELLQDPDVDHVPGVGVDLALDREVELVVMPVPVRVVARPEGAGVPLVGLAGIMETVRGVEVHAPRHGSDGH